MSRDNSNFDQHATVAGATGLNSHRQHDPEIRTNCRPIAVKLTILIIPGQPKVLIRPGKCVTVGRTSDADVSIDDKLISRRHFTIQCNPEGAFIIDQNSTNGTALNGQLIQSAPLASGDRISAGHTQILVLIR